MSQSHGRLFQTWLEAGDDRTFSEWLDYRRHCATESRRTREVLARHQASMRNLAAQLGQRQPYEALQRQAMMQQSQNAYLGAGYGLGGLLGGLIGGKRL